MRAVFYHNSSERLKKELYQEYVSRFLLTRKESPKGLKLGEQAGIGHDEQNSRHRHVLCRSQMLKPDSELWTFILQRLQPGFHELKTDCFLSLAETRNGLHRRIYIADNLKSDNGEFIIDKLLGSSHLQVQSAVDVFGEVILPKCCQKTAAGGIQIEW